MTSRLEITLKESLFDAEGESLRQKAQRYFSCQLDGVRAVTIVTLDVDLTPDQQRRLQSEFFTNPVTQVSSYEPLPLSFDWIIWVGLRPGVRDNAGATAVEAVEDLLDIRLGYQEGIYTSKRYCLQGRGLTRGQVEEIAAELLANDIIQQWRVYSSREWDPQQGVGLIVPKVQLHHEPTVATIPVADVQTLAEVSSQRGLALNPADLPIICEYFSRPAVREQRARLDLGDPTDVELEYISQARSDHCNHNTFQGLFHYRDGAAGEIEIIDNLFKSFIQAPTLELKARKPWVVSVLWDNAGAGRLDDDHYYVITGETHNSPSNMEAYGGAITGIVGVYRDPLGTGKGAKLIMGGYGYCVGAWDYSGPLVPRLHPRRLLEGVIEGVKDGGNKSGIPTTFGQVLFHPGYLGKCLVFVTALGLMPARIDGAPADRKTTTPGDLVIMCGGRVGKDGIHGVTASSEVFSEHTPAGHVQIGDPYTQKKMHDFLLEVRDAGLIRFITDNGGGGLSSSVGESALFANGCEIELEQVPLKYAGLDQWEIWVSESQERMTVAIQPADRDRFMALSAKHEVESTVIGRYTDSGKLHITYAGATCAYVDLDLLKEGFPQWEFEAQWCSPEARGLAEPVVGEPEHWESLLKAMLARPNICSKEWIVRQYDHEVQGSSVIKPLVGARRDMVSDAAVIRPVLDRDVGLAYAQALLPAYSAIDAYHMVMCTVDEAVRRVLAVGGDGEHIGGVDNFCWPNIQFDPRTNPDGKFKAAQLVRACRALKEICLAYEIPLLSGKDSMYVDGHLPDGHGTTHKVSGPETLQFSTVARVADVTRCVTMECKAPGDRLYIIGTTYNELGGSEYYDYLGYVGKNVPRVRLGDNRALYRALQQCLEAGLAASVHGIYRGGLGVHLALSALGGDLGLEVDLARAPCSGVAGDHQLLFAESAGRFLVTVAAARAGQFEEIFKGQPWACIGRVTEAARLRMVGLRGTRLMDVGLEELRHAWQEPFGDLR